MADEEEIKEAVDAARGAGCEELVILHCVSGYPAPANDYNLTTIPDMRERFGVLTGLSDHTIDNTTAIASVALGACLIEKHVTLDRNGGGPDDSFSLEKPELEQLCRDSKTAWSSKGRVNYELKDSEKDNMVFRRSLYAVENIGVGEEFTTSNIRSIRPGYGLKPKELTNILGRKSTKTIERGEPLSWDAIS